VFWIEAAIVELEKIRLQLLMIVPFLLKAQVIKTPDKFGGFFIR
jgi:hypothetical protein